MDNKSKLDGKKNREIPKGDSLGKSTLMDERFYGEIKQINKNLEKLNKKMEKKLSWRRNLLVAIWAGLGTVVGATIVAGILISIFSSMIDSVEDIPILNDIVESVDLKEKINGE